MKRNRPITLKKGLPVTFAVLSGLAGYLIATAFEKSLGSGFDDGYVLGRVGEREDFNYPHPAERYGKMIDQFSRKHGLDL